MATFKSSQYSLQNGENQSPVKAPIGDIGGRIRLLNINYVFTQAVYAVSDIVKLAQLPAGAKIVSARILCPSLGTTGIFDAGWAASDDAVVVADPVVKLPMACPS